MKLSRWAMLTAVAPLVAAGCGSFGNAMTAHTDVVARAAGKEIKVEEAARLMAANPQVPAEPAVVEALADLWVDYTLLATAAAQDTTLASLDLDDFIAPTRDQQVIWKLREQVIQVDTVITPEELQRRWAAEGPGLEVRARHILLSLPPEPTPQQRDSIRALAEQIRARAVAGEDFAALAREFSQDPGSAQQGGDLGFFGRGRMVPAFEEAAFELQPGEISPVVETPFGYHIIRVEERRQQPLGEQEEAFRQYLVQQAVGEAEQAYVENLTKSANIELRPGAAQVAREIAQRRDLKLRGRAAERVVASYKGGELTTAELAREMRTLPPRALDQIGSAPDEQVGELIEQMVRKQLLLDEAARLRLGLTREETEALRAEARQGIQSLLRATGFNRAIPQGAGANAAIEARVREVIEAAIRGERDVPQLDRLGLLLRETYDYEINEGNFSKVVATVRTIRAAQPTPTPPAGQAPPVAPPAGAPTPDGAR